MRSTSPLNGITRNPQAAFSRGVSAPVPHSPVLVQDEILFQVVGRNDGVVKQQGIIEGNLLVTYGMDALCNLIASGGEASDWVHAHAIGTDSTAAATDDTGLGSSKAFVYLSQASMNVSDLGARTTEYQMTYDDALAYQIHEIGLFGSNVATASMIARGILTGTNSIDKGTDDIIHMSHRLVFGTGATS
jgi:hypothetical protein